jgi:hypothetical protein
MEATCVIPRSDKKRLDDIKRVQLALVSGKSVLTEEEKSAIFASAEALDVNGEYRDQELLLKIRQEGQGDPIHIMKMISSFIIHLESQAVRYQKTKSIEAGPGESKRINWQ